MSRMLRCANGHQWPDSLPSDAVTVEVAQGCPVCGSQAVAAVNDTAGDCLTALPASTPASGDGAITGMETLPSEMAQVVMDQTLPSTPPSELPEGTLALPASGSVPAGQDVATMALSPSEQDVLDITEAGEDAVNPRKDDKTLDQTQAEDMPRPTDMGLPRGLTGKRSSMSPTKLAPSTMGRAKKLPTRVAGYEILGELGRGGMGVVYKARQIGLNRLCALKMILAGGFASPESIARFKIEAEAIAHLQHPNIVQVYEIGEADSCPFFSLEFVDGSNLQNKIAATPQPAPEIARLMQQVCAGVDAAHRRGVLHRDLKPANILLTKDDVPKITDFGLAKRIDDADHGQTRTGAILGTPSYMAPEQAMGRAKELGPPADIYALGAILYDMLTGRPPFRGETLMDTLNQVQKMEPLPPARLVPKVALDLQTICLKSLSKDPKKRYATAGDMGEDLRRYLAGEPILARPTPMWERGVKWVKRRPALASSIAVCILAFFSMLLMGGLWLNTERLAAEEREARQTELKNNAEEKANKEAELKQFAEQGRLKEETLRKEAEEQRNRAEEQRNRAEENFTQARDAVKSMLTRIAGVELRYEPRMEQVRRDLLQKALDFNLKFLASRGSDPRVRFETALTYQQVGYIYKEFGRYDDALTPYQIAADRFGELQQKEPHKAEYRLGVAACAMEQAGIWQLQGNLADSEKGYRQAMDGFEALSKEHPNEPLYQEELASVEDNLGSLYLTQGRFQEAEQNYDAALKVRTALVERGDKSLESRIRLARLQRNRAVLLLLLGRVTAAEKALLASRDVCAALVKEAPNVPDYGSDLALTYFNLGICYRKTNRPLLAVEPLRNAIDILQKLQVQFPLTPQYRQDLALATYELGMLQGDQGNLKDAHDQLTKALKVQEKLYADQPTLSVARLQLAKSHISLGIAFVGLQDTDKALKQYQQGVDLLEEIKPAASTTPDICGELARGHENLAELLTALKQPLLADKSWGRLLAIRQELAAAFPQSQDYHTDLAGTHVLFADRFQKAGKTKEAMSSWQAAAQQFGECMILVEANPSLSKEQREAFLKGYGDKAIVALRRAVANGLSDANTLKDAPEYRLLRSRAEFGQLVGDLEGRKSGT